MRVSGLYSLVVGLLCLLAGGVLFAPEAVRAQGNAPSVATLVYFEGSVRVAGQNGDWSSARIDQPLRADQQIQTGSSARAEVEWTNGETTVLGPDQTQAISALFQAQKQQASGEAEGLLQRFTEMFSDESSTQETAGGVRRSKVESDTESGGGLHWKRHAPVDFATAAQLYRDGQYAEAAPKLHLFLQQNPSHSKATLAQFALGHCYVELNNPVQAKATFRDLIDAHPSDPLADRARELLAQY